jgi:predicted acyl esterase
MEITGPLVAKLFIASSTVDADLFVTLRGFTAMDEEITFQGTLDPAVALAHGWLRASHRKLDATRSKPFQPYHSHDELLPLNPGEVYELDVEIWPTCIVLEPGSRIALTIAGRDFARGATGLNDLKNHGSGPFVHNDPDDRPSEVFGGSTTLYTGPEYPSSVLVPIIPAGD